MNGICEIWWSNKVWSAVRAALHPKVVSPTAVSAKCLPPLLRPRCLASYTHHLKLKALTKRSDLSAISDFDQEFWVTFLRENIDVSWLHAAAQFLLNSGSHACEVGLRPKYQVSGGSQCRPSAT